MSDHILVKIFRPEGYEVVPPELVMADVNIHPGFTYEVVDEQAIRENERRRCVGRVDDYYNRLLSTYPNWMMPTREDFFDAIMAGGE